MVGRTPIMSARRRPYDMKMASFVILILAFSILGFSGWRGVSKMGMPDATGALTTAQITMGRTGFSEILYAYRFVQPATTRSAFAGERQRTPW